MPMPDTRPIAFLFRIVDENDVHVRFTVYAGPLGGTLGCCGQLCMRVEEWHEFSEAWRAVRDQTVRIERRQPGGSFPEAAASLYEALSESAEAESLVSLSSPGPGRDGH